MVIQAVLRMISKLATVDKSKVKALISGLFLLFVYLNPYTVVGPVGYFLVAGFLLLVFFKEQNLIIIKFVFLISFFIIIVGLYAALNAVSRGYPSSYFIVPGVAFLLYVTFGYYLAKFFGFRFDFLVKSIVFSATLNGVIILLEVFFPSVRAAIESFLVESGNIDWSEGFRFRGIASGGGASLSLFYACAIHCCFYLFFVSSCNKKYVMSCAAVILFSMFFVGRTGVALSGLIAILWLAFYKPFSSRYLGFRFSLVLISISIINLFLFVGDNIFGSGFTTYVLGAFSDVDGLNEEGTLQVLLQFWSVYPTQFPGVVIGYGSFYNDYLPYIDAGYNRTVASLGFPLAFVFYSTFIFGFCLLARGKLLFFIPFLFILMLAEAKESLLLTGYTARTFMICLGAWFYINKVPYLKLDRSPVDSSV